MTDTWGTAYVKLALRMEKHFPGFVDAYCGPPSLKATIDKEEPSPLESLFEDALFLEDTIPDTTKAREIYLEKQVTGMKTTIRILEGEEISYADQVSLCFDVVPERLPNSRFEKQREVLHDVWKGKDLHEAADAWGKSKEIPDPILTEAVTLLQKECQRRTSLKMSLPPHEHIDFVLVKDKPWSGYNWYLGDFNSRVEINTDVPIRITALPSLVSHEAYPGHHTEHLMKENILYQEKGFMESCIFVYNTPECIISEGIANAGFNLIFHSRKEVYSLLNKHLHASINVENDTLIAEALSILGTCNQNAALMIHEDNCEVSEAVEYLMEVGLTTRERAEKQIQFITHPLFSPYIFNYQQGKEIVSEAYETIDPLVFYQNQMCPSNISCFT
jgi:hypothetical protein